MTIWKRRDPRNKFRRLLEHLDSNFYNTNQRKIEKLKKTFYPYAKELIKQFKKEGLIFENKKEITLKIRGYKYLDYLRNLDLKNELLKYNREKILVQILTVFSLVTAIIGGFLNIPLIKIVIWMLSFVAIIFLIIRFFSFGKFIKN